VLKILSDIEKKRDFIDDGDLHASSDSTKPSFVPKEVSQYMEFETVWFLNLKFEKVLQKVFMTMYKRKICGPEA
jgi:hypothetical protein